MANGRNPKRKGHDTSRDQGGFIALPWSVLDCPAYARLSHPAKALLFEVARQFVRDNNGRLLLSRAYMAKRGWKSADTVSKAKREQIAAAIATCAVFWTTLASYVLPKKMDIGGAHERQTHSCQS